MLRVQVDLWSTLLFRFCLLRSSPVTFSIKFAENWHRVETSGSLVFMNFSRLFFVDVYSCKLFAYIFMPWGRSELQAFIPVKITSHAVVTEVFKRIQVNLHDYQSYKKTL